MENKINTLVKNLHENGLYKATAEDEGIEEKSWTLTYSSGEFVSLVAAEIPFFKGENYWTLSIVDGVIIGEEKITKNERTLISGDFDVILGRLHRALGSEE